jgi:hypothetical protein
MDNAEQQQQKLLNGHLWGALQRVNSLSLFYFIYFADQFQLDFVNS